MVTSGWPTPERPESSIFVAEQVARLRDEGVQVDVVHYEGRMDPRNYLRARREVRAALAAAGPDLVHGHFGQTGLVILPSLVPSVLTLHGSDVLGVIDARGRYSWRGPVLRSITRWAVRRADRVIVAGKLLADRLQLARAYDVLPMGVDTTVFRPGDRAAARRALGLGLDETIVLFAGDPAVARKRFPLAEEAVAEADNEIRLITVTRKSREEMVLHLQAVDALLVTSIHESGPVIVKEAVACDVPVVSVDVGDVRSVVGTLDGCAVCDASSSSLAKELDRVLALGRAGATQDVLSRIDQRSLARRQIEIYRAVLAERDAQRAS